MDVVLDSNDIVSNETECPSLAVASSQLMRITISLLALTFVASLAVFRQNQYKNALGCRLTYQICTVPSLKIPIVKHGFIHSLKLHCQFSRGARIIQSNKMKSFITIACVSLSILLANSGANADCIPGYTSTDMAECNSHCGTYVCVSSGGPYQCGYCN